MTVDGRDRAEERTEEPGSDKEEELGGKMSFIEHLEELRRRILVCLITIGACFLVIYSTSIATLKEYFTRSLFDVLDKMDSSLIYTGMAEGFFFDIKLSLMAALFISIPMVFYQVWAFVAPGLYKHERRYAGPFIVFSTLFFSGGASFFYFVVFPIAAEFFSQFALEGKIQWTPKLSDVFSFVMMMVLAFGLVFELPVVVFVLARMKIVSASFLRKNRKYALLIMVVGAALFTPPDVVSQLLLAGPMWLLYELSVLVAWAFGPRQKKTEQED